MVLVLLRQFVGKTISRAKETFKYLGAPMDITRKRKLDGDGETELQAPVPKNPKTQDGDAKDLPSLKHGKGRDIPRKVVEQLGPDDIDLLENVDTSCLDLSRIMAAIQLRKKYRLCTRLPEAQEDSSYFIKDGLRFVYPYQYLYQAYAKRRWIGRSLKSVIQEEFRDISDELLKQRFDMKRILVNGEPASYTHTIRDNDFLANRNHRHELPVLAAPIKIIHQDKDTVVICKPPSIPIHSCGRYRHNSIVNIMRKDYGMEHLKVVHRLDRLVSGVLIFAKSSSRANKLETLIKNRQVQKEYVCRVLGEFPIGDPSDDGEITVDQPLEILAGKIGVSVVHKDGKPSVTKFKRLNFNGKTSAVLCKPKTGRMHQIRVHLQYLGFPIINDTLYNCPSFGPDRGKDGNYGKSLKQLSNDIISMHRAQTWLITDGTDVIGPEETVPEVEESSELDAKVMKYLSDSEREETMAVLSYYTESEEATELAEKWQFDDKKLLLDPTCRDCRSKYHDPPPRSLFVYLHALKYYGEGFCYESDLPVWAQESWSY